MSTDILLFKCRKVDDDVINTITGKDVCKMADMYNFTWHSKEDYEERMFNLLEIKDYLRPVRMTDVVFDRKACFAAFGMPEDTLNYYQTTDISGMDVYWGENQHARIRFDEAKKYESIIENTYYIYQREMVNISGTDYMSRRLWDIVNSMMQAKCNDNINHTYTPHRLSEEESIIVLRELAKQYKSGDIHIGTDDEIETIMELLLNENGDLFIEGQN